MCLAATGGLHLELLVELIIVELRGQTKRMLCDEKEVGGRGWA